MQKQNEAGIKRIQVPPPQPSWHEALTAGGVDNRGANGPGSAVVGRIWAPVGGLFVSP